MKDEALKVCENLLEKNLPPHMRKSFDTIKTRITKQVGQAAGKGGKDAPGAEPTQTEAMSSEVIGYLELITTQIKEDATKAPEIIKKAMEILSSWEPTDTEEVELELHAELWCKLG